MVDETIGMVLTLNAGLCSQGYRQATTGRRDVERLLAGHQAINALAKLAIETGDFRRDLVIYASSTDRRRVWYPALTGNALLADAVS